MIFEICTVKIPYEGKNAGNKFDKFLEMTAEQAVTKLVLKKAQLVIPSEQQLSPKIFGVFEKCQEHDLNSRPDFKKICDILELE